jgi:starch synthase
VLDIDERPQAGTGLVFGAASAAALWDAVGRAFALWAEPARRQAAQRRAMAMDFSWRRSAELYAALYGETLASPRR